MMSLIPTLVLGLLATVGNAATNPQYQKPTVVIAVDYAGVNATTCGTSTLSVLSDQADITADDCSLISKGWANTGDFNVLASSWVNSTADVDHFYIYETQGTCEFAFKRTDGLDDQAVIGSTDLEDLVARAIATQGTATISPVEGVISCRSASGADGAQIEWTLRKPL